MRASRSTAFAVSARARAFPPRPPSRGGGGDGDVGSARARLERVLREQTSLKTQELARAVIDARGRGYGASVVERDDGAVLLVVEPVGAAHEHAEAAARLNALGLGYTALRAIRDVCAWRRDQRCVVQLVEPSRGRDEFRT